MSLVELPELQQPPVLLETLQDIAEKVKIDFSDFSVEHPDYKPSCYPGEVVARFKKLPDKLQTNLLQSHLQSFLYGIYYNASLRSQIAETDAPPVLHENTHIMGLDPTFYGQLHENNRGQGYFDPGWVVLKQEDDGTLAVRRTTLTVHIDRSKHLSESEREARVGDTVSILMPRNLVQNGFYMAVGNSGIHFHGADLVRIYVNVTPKGAIVLMRQLTEQLNARSIPFTFKLLYDPKNYTRFDSGVLYFSGSNYEAVRSVMQDIYCADSSYFQSDIPLFTKPLAPGIALAEEPNQKFAERESFGLNRCHIIASAMVATHQQGNDSVQARVDAIVENFALLGLSIDRPYLNPGSDDIYLPL
jgi:hypothetical protein